MPIGRIWQQATTDSSGNKVIRLDLQAKNKIHSTLTKEWCPIAVFYDTMHQINAESVFGQHLLLHDFAATPDQEKEERLERWKKECALFDLLPLPEWCWRLVDSIPTLGFPGKSVIIQLPEACEYEEHIMAEALRLCLAFHPLRLRAELIDMSRKSRDESESPTQTTTDGKSSRPPAHSIYCRASELNGEESEHFKNMLIEETKRGYSAMILTRKAFGKRVAENSEGRKRENDVSEARERRDEDKIEPKQEQVRQNYAGRKEEKVEESFPDDMFIYIDASEGFALGEEKKTKPKLTDKEVQEFAKRIVEDPDFLHIYKPTSQSVHSAYRLNPGVYGLAIDNEGMDYLRNQPFTSVQQLRRMIGEAALRAMAENAAFIRLLHLCNDWFSLDKEGLLSQLEATFESLSVDYKGKQLSELAKEVLKEHWNNDKLASVLARCLLCVVRDKGDTRESFFSKLCMSPSGQQSQNFLDKMLDGAPRRPLKKYCDYVDKNEDVNELLDKLRCHQFPSDS